MQSLRFITSVRYLKPQKCEFKRRNKGKGSGFIGGAGYSPLNKVNVSHFSMQLLCKAVGYYCNDFYINSASAI